MSDLNNIEETKEKVRLLKDKFGEVFVDFIETRERAEVIMEEHDKKRHSKNDALHSVPPTRSTREERKANVMHSRNVHAMHRKLQSRSDQETEPLLPNKNPVFQRCRDLSPVRRRRRFCCC